ncbi:sulfotransferase family protein [Alicyclobacillus fodiniaquatilis]|uniref:Sulfotransferase family protein n=1 Tax=Alicyclobacillus fodiniaquatilis TaxID=1661150 RepID=A0ABW4JPU8_9BACL
MLPNFILVGSAKSGTTALDYFLKKHKDIYMSPVKESHFFSSQEITQFNGPGDEGILKGIVRDVSTYEGLFTGVTNEKVVGESSVYYLYYPQTPKTIKSLVPHAKIIIVLRNPIDRAYSAYWHLLRDQRENLSFEKALNIEGERQRNNFEPIWMLKGLGMYYEQIKRYIDTFGRESVFIVIYDEFVSVPNSVLVNLYKFLGVDETVEVSTDVQLNKSGIPRSKVTYDFITKPNSLKTIIKPFLPQYLRQVVKARLLGKISFDKPRMDATTRRNLVNVFYDDIRRLEYLLERDLSFWT